jgi:hypothetical protein
MQKGLLRYMPISGYKTAPLDAINHALEEALDELTVPTTTIGKIAKTPVRKVGGLGASLEFGDEPKPRQLPTQPELRLDSPVGRFCEAPVVDNRISRLPS